MARVVLDKVSKTFAGGTVAVEDVSLEIADGEFVVLVGPSGCGKSTVLRMVAGLETMTTGTILIDNVVVNNLPPKTRDVAMVFQNYALYPHMTVAENLSFSLKLSHLSKPQIHERVADTAHVLGLDALLNRKPKALSGGQRQRVAMGRAIIRQPRVFLMDEPLSNLDAKLRVAMRAELTRLHHRYHITTLYVTHDQVEAMTLGDRIAVLDRGRLQQVGTPQELYDDPCNVFVAGFIGSPSMNLARATVTGLGDSINLDVDGHRWRLPKEALAAHPDLALYIDRDVVFGLRPHHVGEAPAYQDAPLVAVRPVTIESLGHEANVLFVPPFGTALQPRETALGDARSAVDEAEAADLWTAQLDASTTITANRPVELYLDLRYVNLFDADSSQTLRSAGRRTLVGQL